MFQSFSSLTNHSIAEVTDLLNLQGVFFRALTILIEDSCQQCGRFFSLSGDLAHRRKILRPFAYQLRPEHIAAPFANSSAFFETHLAFLSNLCMAWFRKVRRICCDLQ